MASLTAAATALLAARGNNDQTDKTQNANKNLSAENIVANDVTTIDAVTADDANMAADAGLVDNIAVNSSAPAPAKSGPKSPERTSEPAANGIE